MIKRDLPLVAIVGRPNTGKSTLFNRMIGMRKAITDRTAGSTRDRLYGKVSRKGTGFILVDTGGFFRRDDFSDPLLEKVKEGIGMAIDESDIVLFLLDAKEGLNPLDIELASLLRERGRTVIPCINKVDSEKRREGIPEFFSLGMHGFIPISAVHGGGVDDLLDEIVRLLCEKVGTGVAAGPGEGGVEMVRFAVVGRPNVGKSSLINRIMGQEVALVHERPGTTRDSVDIEVDTEHGRFLIIDTAGMRRRSRVERGIERWAVLRAIRSSRRSDVCALVIDGEEGLAAQDGTIAELVQEGGAGIVLVVNKWDIAKKRGDSPALWASMISRRLGKVSHAPIIFTSVLEGSGVEDILPGVARVSRERRKRVKTPALNRFSALMNENSPLPSKGKKGGRILYAVQKENTVPPTFIFFTSLRGGSPPEGYRRFLERGLRERFGFNGVPLRIHFRRRPGG